MTCCRWHRTSHRHQFIDWCMSPKGLQPWDNKESKKASIKHHPPTPSPPQWRLMWLLILTVERQTAVSPPCVWVQAEDNEQINSDKHRSPLCPEKLSSLLHLYRLLFPFSPGGLACHHITVYILDSQKIKRWLFLSSSPSFLQHTPVFSFLQCRAGSRTWPDSRGGFHVTGTDAKGSDSSLPANSFKSYFFLKCKMIVKMTTFLLGISVLFFVRIPFTDMLWPREAESGGLSLHVLDADLHRVNSLFSCAAAEAGH